MTGRTDGNKRIVFPADKHGAKVGDYVKVKVQEVRGHTLKGFGVGKCDIKGVLQEGIMRDTVA